MSQEENSEENQETVSLRELQKLEKRRDELVGGIVQVDKDSTESVSTLEKYTDQAIADYRSDVKTLHTLGQNVEAVAGSAIDNLATKAKSTINSALNYFNTYFLILVGSLIAVGVFGGYLFGVYIPSLAWGFFVGWAFLSLIVLLYLWSLPKSLSVEKLDEEVLAESANLKRAISSNPLTIHDLSPIKRFTKSATSGIRSLVSFALEIVPNGDKIVEMKRNQIRQQKFTEDFIFALHRYRIDASKEAYDIMITKSWVSDNVSIWLEDVSKEMAQIFSNIDPRLFQLIYYEFFDEKYASKIWTQNINNYEFRKQIAWVLVDRKLITVPDFEKSLPIIADLLSRVPKYNLEDAQETVSGFFSDLAAFKASCERHLDFFGLQIVEKLESLNQYVPKSSGINNWRDETISFIAGQICAIKPIIVRLLVESGEGDQGITKTWVEMIEKGELEELAAILSRKRIRPRFGDFAPSIFLRHLELALAHNRQEFSLTEIESTLQALEAEIVLTKHRIQRTISEFRLNTISLDFVSGFVPSKISSIEDDLLNTLSLKLEIDSDVVRLMFDSANGLDRAQETYEKIVKSSKIEQLAQILVERSFITKGKFNSSTVFLLRTQSSFNLSGFISIYIRYESLSESLDAFYPFLKGNGVLNRDKPLELREILSVCPPHLNESLENQLLSLASTIVVQEVEGNTLDSDQHHDLALASTALFMRTHGYPGYAMLCQRASRREFARRVLFQYISLIAEEALSGSKKTLKNAITKAVSEPVATENYEYFKTELADGKLASSAVYLFSQFRLEVNAAFKKVQDNGFEIQTLKNFVESIKELLTQLIDERIVKEFLVNQVISAYLFTVPGAAPGFRFLESENSYIMNAEKELASSQEDQTYLKLVRLSKGTGKATRVGLVPLELSFEEFTTKFKEVWNRAVQLYNETENTQDSLPCFLIRIFPSEDGLKDIMLESNKQNKPLEVVRGLIRESVSAEDSVSILSLIQKAPNGKVALTKAIQAIFDNKKSSLKMMTAGCSNILSKSTKLLRRFDERKIDQSLFDDYQVKEKSIFYLGEKIAKRALKAGEKAAESEFQERMNKALQGITDLPSADVEILVTVVFKQLKSIGAVSVIQSA